MSGAKQFRAAVIIGYMLSITWLRRNLLSLVWLFATPFSLLFIITVTTGGRSFALGVIGSLLLVLSTVGTGLAGDATWYRLETKLQDFFVASPVNQFGYLLGIAFAGLFFASPARDRLPRLNVHFESTKWMAIRATPKRPRRNPTASLLPGRDSSTQHSASHLCNSHNQRRPSNTRRHGHCPDPTLLVSPYWLVIDRRLTCARSRSDLACGEMATALATIQRGVQTSASSISKPAEETL